MMMSLILLATGSVVMAQEAPSANSDEQYTIAQCQSVKGSAEKLEVTIVGGGFTGMVLGQVSLINRAGTAQVLGSVRVDEQPRGELMGAPLTYLGQNFRLNIVTDAGPRDGGFISYFTGRMAGRQFDETMTCVLYSR